MTKIALRPTQSCGYPRRDCDGNACVTSTSTPVDGAAFASFDSS